MPDFHIPLVENALENDKLFIFRVDEIDDEHLLTDNLIGEYFTKLNISKYIYATEYAKETKKLHYHVLCILPDQVTYKYASDQFLREIVKKINLGPTQFSKKKNGERSNPKYKAMKDAMDHFNMKWYDYLALYFSKDDDYKNTINPGDGSLYLKYKEFQAYLDGVKPKPKNSNHIKILIDGWKGYVENDEALVFCYNSLPPPDLSFCQSEDDKRDTYLRTLLRYILEYFSHINKNNRLAQLLSSSRIQMYMYTILTTYHPVYIQCKEESMLNSFKLY